MQRVNMKSLDLDNIDRLLGGSVVNEIRRMEQERALWMKAVTHRESVAEQVKKLVGETSLAVQIAEQWQQSQLAEQESIRRMLAPLQDIRKGLLADSATKRMLDELAKPFAASEQIAKFMEQATGSSALIGTIHSSIEGSMESARKLLADVSISSGIGQVMKSFEEANRRWVVPHALLNSLGPLQVLQWS